MFIFSWALNKSIFNIHISNQHSVKNIVCFFLSNALKLYQFLPIIQCQSHFNILRCLLWYNFSQLSKSLLAFCDYSNKLPQNCWLKPTKIYSPTVLEAKNLKLVSVGQNQCQRVMLPLEILCMDLFLASSNFWWLLEFFGLWPHHFNLSFCGNILSSSLYINSCSASLIMTL